MDTRNTIHETESKKIRSFTDLRAWRENHCFAVKIYQVTKQFPTDEQFGLSNQLRRAAVSVTSNIAEGFGRDSMQEKLRFYYIARGSLTEVQSQLMIARDVGYVNGADFILLAEQSQESHKVLSGLIKKTKQSIDHRIS